MKKQTKKFDIKKFFKTVAVFIGLKLLEIATIVSIPTIIIYIILCLSEWNWDGTFLNIISNIFQFGGYVFIGLFVGIAGIAMILDWLKSNWTWAKEIVGK